ncbi:MAG: nuclear transport factor 2 family protein [Povalibacter sp.]
MLSLSTSDMCRSHKSSFRAVLATTAWVSAAFILSACSSNSTRDDSHNKANSEQLRARAEALLHRYASNDPEGVVALIDSNDFTMYGSDISEVVHSTDELRALMRNDFLLWGTASFGELKDFDSREDGNLATTFFTASFKPGSFTSLPVRFSMTWRKHDGQWLLTQSSNTVPTVGQSAAELLKGQGR